ncbi:MAG TPA: hypothetical protein VFN27_05350 [Xanthobacteraceae bacterium]|nr:hypothetical protein [Xanthobacteraceae bacterium]
MPLEVSSFTKSRREALTMATLLEPAFCYCAVASLSDALEVASAEKRGNEIVET